MSLSRSDSSDNNSNNGKKYCTVCGHPIARNNFGALSCNACAAFFRRTLIQGRQYSCHCSDILSAEQGNVRECKFCRFQKCVRVGMQEKAIRSMEVWKWRIDMSKIRRPSQKAHKKCSIKIKNEPVESDEPEDIKDIKSILPLTPFVTKVILPEDLFETDVLQNLQFAEQKLFRVQNSRSTISDDIIERISQMKWTDVVEMQDNLLAKAEEFSLEAPPCFDKEMLNKQKQLETQGAWFDVFIKEQSVWFESYIRILLCSIGFAKTLPFFRKLNLQDQCVLLRRQALPLIDLFICFYSMQSGSQVLIHPNGFPLIETFAFSCFKGDPVVWKLAEKVNCHALSHMLVVAPSREEFAYLLALIFTNPAIAGLSLDGQKLLQEESEKYSRGLLRLQQREYGDGMGALRYADTLRLVANSILNAQKHRELVVYLDTVHDKGRFEALLPKSLIPFCTMNRCI